MAPPTMEEIKALKRAELQKLCKEAGIKANSKNVVLIEALCTHFYPSVEEPSPSPEAEINTAPTPEAEETKADTEEEGQAMDVEEAVVQEPSAPVISEKPATPQAVAKVAMMTAAQSPALAKLGLAIQKDDIMGEVQRRVEARKKFAETERRRIQLLKQRKESGEAAMAAVHKKRADQSFAAQKKKTQRPSAGSVARKFERMHENQASKMKSVLDVHQERTKAKSIVPAKANAPENASNRIDGSQSSKVTKKAVFDIKASLGRKLSYKPKTGPVPQWHQQGSFKANQPFAAALAKEAAAAVSGRGSQ